MSVAPPAQNRPVMIVEDDLTVCELIKAVAVGKGLATHFYESFADARAALGRVGPGLVFVDLLLKASHGAEVLELLAEAEFSGFVAVISGRPWDEIKTVDETGRSFGLRMLPPMVKPLSPLQLEKILAAYVDETLMASLGDRAAV